MPSTTHLDHINKHVRSGYWSLIFWLPLLVVAGMGFDAPNSQSHVLPWAFLCFVLLIPAIILIAPRFAREALKRGNVKTAYAIVITPQTLVFTPMLISLIVAVLTGLDLWKL